VYDGRVIPLITWLLVAAAAQESQTPGYREHVDVTRVLVDARVVDREWRPVRDLGPSDFVVRIDGRAARIESAQWVAATRDERQDLSETRASETQGSVGRPPPGSRRQPPAVEGRLIVFVLQKDLESSRIAGLMRMLRETRSFLDAFTPYDRVAVLSFDSHLRVWLDFTADLDRVDRVLAHDLLFGRDTAVQAGDPTLLDTIPLDTARRTYSIERALTRLGEALAPKPGSKVVVLVGHGFGRLGLNGVSMEPEYDEARRTLQAARAAVFCLDVTQADYHSLEVGLQTVADETGGIYQRTHIFSTAAMERLASVLGGHYVLFVEKPPLGRGEHRIDVRLNRRSGTVYARTAFVD
jgi:VWFA-related protein